MSNQNGHPFSGDKDLDVAYRIDKIMTPELKEQVYLYLYTLGFTTKECERWVTAFYKFWLGRTIKKLINRLNDEEKRVVQKLSRNHDRDNKRRNVDTRTYAALLEKSSVILREELMGAWKYFSQVTLQSIG